MPQSDLPEISAIICTWNRAHELVGALESFNQQTLARNRWELIVVDNNSTDNTPHIIQEAANTANYTLVGTVEKQQGLSRARNTGIQTARAPVVAFTDDDCLIDPAWLESILNIFQTNPQVDMLGGTGLTVYPPITQTDPKKRILAQRFFGDFRPYDTLMALDTRNLPIGFNFSFRKCVSEKVGGFDPALGVTGSNYIAHEETAFIRAAQALGCSCYFDPRPIVYHRIQEERICWPAIRKQAYQGAAGSYLMRYAQQVQGHPLKRLQFSLLFGCEMLYAAVRFVLYLPSFRKRTNARFRLVAAAGKLKALWSH